jgi:hypothetical protein
VYGGGGACVYMFMRMCVYVGVRAGVCMFVQVVNV